MSATRTSLAKQALEVLARPRGLPAAGRCGSCARSRSIFTGRLPAQARRGILLHWRRPGEGGGERPVHPRRLPRSVRAAGARAYRRPRLALPIPGAKPLELPDSLARDAQGSSSCTWCPNRPSIAPTDGIPWPQIYGHYLDQCQTIHDTIKAMPHLRPDLVVAHGGRGAPSLFLREVLDCPIVIYCEYYFATSHRDISYRIDLPPAEPAPFFPRSYQRPDPGDAWSTATPAIRQPTGRSSRFPQGSIPRSKSTSTASTPSFTAPGPRRGRSAARSIPKRHEGGDLRLARARVDPRVRSLHEGRQAHLQGPLGRDLRRGRRRRDSLRLGQAPHRQSQFQGMGAARGGATIPTGSSSPAGSCPSIWLRSSG